VDGGGELMGKLLGSFAGFLSESGTMNRGRGITAQTDPWKSFFLEPAGLKGLRHEMYIFEDMINQ
jgi:hypothetical protein